MNIVIFGLPGTGKTTLCKNLCKKYNYNYITDYDILSQLGYKFENSVEIIDIDFSNLISSFFIDNEPKNCIFDFNYIISPAKISKIANYNEMVILYLGFYDINKEDLFDKFAEINPELKNNELTEIVNLFVEVSNKYKMLCDENKIDFISINYDKNEILKKLQNEISAVIES